MSALDIIFKAYDIRGTVPDQLNTDLTRSVGVAFAAFEARNYAGVPAVDKDPTSYVRAAEEASQRQARALEVRFGAKFQFASAEKFRDVRHQFWCLPGLGA